VPELKNMNGFKGMRLICLDIQGLREKNKIRLKKEISFSTI